MAGLQLAALTGCMRENFLGAHGAPPAKHLMREHYKIERRASAALDLILALAIGLTLAGLALAYFDILWS